LEGKMVNNNPKNSIKYLKKEYDPDNNIEQRKTADRLHYDPEKDIRDRKRLDKTGDEKC